MYYKIAQLTQTSGPKSNSASEVFIAQPDSQKELLAGKLFVIIEIESRDQKSLKFINFLVSELNHNYYQNEKLILRERVNTIKTEHVFESALAKTNKNLGEYFKNPNNFIDVKTINATIGVIYENILHFSILGKNKAFLIYKNTNSKEPDKYKLTDISETPTDESDNEIKAPNQNKLFTNIINGLIPENGYFFFANETLPEYLSNKQLLDIITTLPPTGAVEQFKNLLGHANAYVSFLGIIIKNTLGQASIESEKVIRSTNSYSPVNSLNTTETKTEKLLTPSGLIDVSKWFTKLSGLFFLPSFGANKNSLSSNRVMLTDKLSFKKRASFKLIKNSWQNLKNVLALLLQLLIHLPKLLNKDKINDTYNTIKTLPIGQARSFKSWIISLSKKHKLIITVSLGLIIFFIFNSIVMNNNNKKQAELAANQALAKTIEEKQNLVDSDLVFNNEDGANSLLTEIKPLLAQLAPSSPEYNGLVAKNQQQTSKVLHEVKVTPTEIANFSNLNQAAKPTNLIFADGKLYSADALNNKIYSIGLTDKVISTIDGLDQASSTLDYPTLSNNELYYFSGDSLTSLDIKTETIKKYALITANPDSNIKGMSIYYNRLYLLSPQNKQIYRYTQGVNKFSGSTAWLNQPTDFSSAVSLAIDSNIFVLKSNGQITKFSKGAPAPFSLAKVTPPLENINKFTIATTNIYLLDAKNKRLIAFDKTGKLSAQYQLAQLNNMTDFTIDEANKKAYILNDTSVEQINL